MNEEEFIARLTMPVLYCYEKYDYVNIIREHTNLGNDKTATVYRTVCKPFISISMDEEVLILHEGARIKFVGYYQLPNSIIVCKYVRLYHE